MPDSNIAGEQGPLASKAQRNAATRTAKVPRGRPSRYIQQGSADLCSHWLAGEPSSQVLLLAFSAACLLTRCCRQASLGVAHGTYRFFPSGPDGARLSAQRTCTVCITHARYSFLVSRPFCHPPAVGRLYSRAREVALSHWLCLPSSSPEGH